MDKTALLHRNYWIGILIVIIVCLLTMRYTPDAQLKDYVSFAATLASLILAILAIVQAMYSSSSLNETILSLKKSSKEIGANTNNLNGVIGELQAKIINLPIEVEERVNAQLLPLLDKQVQPTIQNQASEKEQGAFTEKIDEKYYENYVKLSSVNGLLVLHAIRLAIQNNKSFRFYDLLPENHRSINLENMQGYFVAHIAAGFVIPIQNGDLYSFQKSNIKPKFIDETIRVFLKRDDNPLLVGYFISVKNQIDKFLAA